MLNNCTSGEKVNSTHKGSEERKINNRLQSQQGVNTPGPGRVVSSPGFRLLSFLNLKHDLEAEESSHRPCLHNTISVWLVLGPGKEGQAWLVAFWEAAHLLPVSNLAPPPPQFPWLYCTWACPACRAPFLGSQCCSWHNGNLESGPTFLTVWWHYP